MSGFCDAMRSFQPGLSEFKAFAEETIIDYINALRRDNNERLKVESKYVLDKYPGYESFQDSVNFRLTVSDHSERVILKDFLNTLDEISRSVARLIIDEYTIDEISLMLNAPKSLVEYTLTEIGKDMQDYFQYENIGRTKH